MPYSGCQAMARRSAARAGQVVKPAGPSGTHPFLVAGRTGGPTAAVTPSSGPPRRPEFRGGDALLRRTSPAGLAGQHRVPTEPGYRGPAAGVVGAWLVVGIGGFLVVPRGGCLG